MSRREKREERERGEKRKEGASVRLELPDLSESSSQGAKKNLFFLNIPVLIEVQFRVVVAKIGGGCEKTTDVEPRPELFRDGRLCLVGADLSPPLFSPTSASHLTLRTYSADMH